MTEVKTLRFRTPSGDQVVGRVKNPDATLGTTAARLAARLGIAGSFECVGPDNQVIAPDTRLADLPDEAEITLASELTPA